MKTVELGELVAPAKVQRAGNTDYPVLSMTMHGGLVAQTDRFKKRIASSDTSDYKVVRRGQLVVGFPINEGVLDFQLHHDAALVSPAYGVWNLRDESRADRTYLKRFLKSPRAIEYYVGKMKGSTARRRSLPAAEFNAMPIPLPPLTEQRRIAAILDHADALRAKRRRVLTHLDALTQSVFQGMFGGESWPSTPLAEVVRVGTLVTYGIVQAGPEFDGGVPYIRTGDLVDGQIATAGLRHTDPAIAARFERSTVRAGDIVMSIRATVGTTALVPPELDGANLTQGTARIAPGEGTVGTYLLECLRSPETQHWIQGQIKGATFREITLGRLRELEVPLPPIPLQEEFAARIESIGAHRASIVGASSADELLFASLQARAFRGEL
ncbi:restriction endonuclease subunit S [Ornithinimicrobium sp. F0845]|uniref:restriction endonuclease subunit S n=1 Tax=Ornithinimicrobium sp. F0845 TaxID=2926412 RepID=UPI001FF46B4E|nr:restriction endonuclease subunit S [Ornithinimicrobium sp. F0845]